MYVSMYMISNIPCTVPTLLYIITTCFSTSRNFLPDQSLRSDQETKDVMQDRLKALAATFCGVGIQRLVPRYDKCLILHRDRVANCFTARIDKLK